MIQTLAAFGLLLSVATAGNEALKFAIFHLEADEKRSLRAAFKLM